MHHAVECSTLWALWLCRLCSSSSLRVCFVFVFCLQFTKQPAPFSHTLQSTCSISPQFSMVFQKNIPVYCSCVWWHLYHLDAFTTNWKTHKNGKSVGGTGLGWKIVVDVDGLASTSLFIDSTTIHSRQCSFEWDLKTVISRSKSLSLWQRSSSKIYLAVRHFRLLISATKMHKNDQNWQIFGAILRHAIV